MRIIAQVQRILTDSEFSRTSLMVYIYSQEHK